ncbi:MAG: A24 family peptidase [Asticcacaulis sp.]
MLIPVLFALAYPACLVWAAVSDIRSMTIPNRLTLLLASGFVPVAFLCHLSVAQLGLHVGVGLAGLVLGIILFALRLMGGGDAKLIAAASLWLGVHGAIAMLIYTALAGGVLTLGLLAARKAPIAALTGPLPGWVNKHLSPQGDIPYGVAICAGGLLAISDCDLLPLLGL